MRIKCISFENEYANFSVNDINHFAGIAAGVCYMPNDFYDLASESDQKCIKRALNCIKNGHHSVFDHVHVSLVLEDVPKILCMVLNNEKVYTTSEKSARYTIMKNLNNKDKYLYEKWTMILSNIISQKYPDFDKKTIEKKALENSRYFIGIFTNCSTMLHTISIRQLNYEIYMMEQYIENNKNANELSFEYHLSRVFKEFLENVAIYKIDGLIPVRKDRELSLFNYPTDIKEEFGINYSTTYKASFSCLAQLQRHRKIAYSIKLDKYPRFYIPNIIKGITTFEYQKNFNHQITTNPQVTTLTDLWIQDMNSMKFNYPQGMLVNINESGSMDDFIDKLYERNCCQAQLETTRNCNQVFYRYLESLKLTMQNSLHDKLAKYEGPRCKFDGFDKCNSRCLFGRNNYKSREI